MTPGNARLDVQAAIDAQKSASERNEMGQFATPPSLAREIVKTALDYLPEGTPIRFLEPALGTGSFFESLLATARKRIVAAAGVDIDPLFARAANDLWRGTCLRVVNEDFTRLEPLALGQCNLLITNPPYVRHHHIDAWRKKELVAISQRASGIKVSGLAGLYVHFMMLAHKWLEPGAVSAWLIPSEFMDVNYGDGLKQYLTERVELVRMHRFCSEDVQFEDALVTSTVVIFRNRLPGNGTVVRYTQGGTMSVPRESADVNVSEFASTRKWSSLPKATASPSPPPDMTLGDAFTIRRGLATGDNKFFIRPVSEFAQIGIPTQFLKPILPPPRSLDSLLVEADADGYPLTVPKLALLDCSLSERDVKLHYPSLWKFILSGKALRVDQGYLCGGRTPWYSQERRESPPIVCTYMGRSRDGQAPFRIIRNKSQAVATNVYLLLYPKAWLLRADTEGNLIDRACDELRLLSAQAFTAEGRVYGGGLHKLEPRELARLPLNMEELLDADRDEVRQQPLFEEKRPYIA